MQVGLQRFAEHDRIHKKNASVGMAIDVDRAVAGSHTVEMLGLLLNLLQWNTRGADSEEWATGEDRR